MASIYQRTNKDGKKVWRMVICMIGSFNTARNWFDHCQNVIVWGCNLNDYDSILLTVLTSATINKQHRMNFFLCKPNKASLEENLKDYFSWRNLLIVFQVLTNNLHRIVIKTDALQAL